MSSQDPRRDYLNSPGLTDSPYTTESESDNEEVEYPFQHREAQLGAKYAFLQMQHDESEYESEPGRESASEAGSAGVDLEDEDMASPYSDEGRECNWSFVNGCSRIWADTSGHIQSVLTWLASTRALSNGNPVRLANDLWAVYIWLADLEMAIGGITSSSRAPHEHDTIDLQGHLLAMIPVVRAFTRDGMYIESQYTYQVERRKSEFMLLFYNYKARMDRTDRTLKNAATRTMVCTLEDRRYAFLLEMFLEIYAMLREYFYSFRLIIA